MAHDTPTMPPCAPPSLLEFAEATCLRFDAIDRKLDAILSAVAHLAEAVQTYQIVSLTERRAIQGLAKRVGDLANQTLAVHEAQRRAAGVRGDH